MLEDLCPDTAEAYNRLDRKSTRDEAHITSMLDRLKAAWLRSPELRLGQLVSNGNHVALESYDSFGTPDEILIEGIEGVYQKLNSDSTGFVS